MTKSQSHLAYYTDPCADGMSHYIKFKMPVQLGRETFQYGRFHVGALVGLKDGEARQVLHPGAKIEVVLLPQSESGVVFLKSVRPVPYTPKTDILARLAKFLNRTPASAVPAR